MWRYNYSNELYHHGILGQKWGVRRFQNKDGTRTRAGKLRYEDNTNRQESMTTKTKSGAEVVLDRTKTPAFTQFITKYNKNARERLANSPSFKISVNGKKVGELDLYKESSDSLNVIWVEIDKAHEGKGYGTAVMKSAINYAKQTKCKQVTLEVPGVSPNAKHIYEKLGFKDTGETLGEDDDVWGGLTKMRLTV